MEVEEAWEDGPAGGGDDLMMSDGEIPAAAAATAAGATGGQGRRPLAKRRFAEALNIRRPGQYRSSATAEGRHVRVAGLDYSILTSDLEELFRSVGPIEKCWIDFDRTDRSLGTGGVIFKTPVHARMAVQQFDGRFIDGQPLQLEIAGRTIRQNVY